MAYYTEEQRIELIDIICKEVSKGRALRNVIKDDGMPHATTFYSWIDDNKSRLEQYTRACDDRADGIFEDMFDIADDGTNDFIKKDIGDGIEVEQLNSEHIQRSRLRIDTRKWILSKMQPKKYGDKLEVEQTNKGTIQFENVSKQFPDQK